MENWDADVAAMNLSEVEKNGLQVFRNYQRAFEAHAEKKFAEELDAETFDLAPLQRVLTHVVTEDARFLPVIVCAYVDDLLQAMFRAELPDGVPGGTSALFGPYGPLSNLFNRLQLSYAFDMLSSELMHELDKVRKARNDLSHTWDLRAVPESFDSG